MNMGFDEITQLEGKIIMLCLGGSHAYGLNVEDSDEDIRGIALESKAHYIGNTRFEQLVKKEPDLTIYGLQKFFTFLTKNNPNIIELMGVSREDLTVDSEIYRELKDNIQLFLSKKIGHTFGGYASDQLARIKNALIRSSDDEKEKEEHILKSVKKHFYENQEFELVIGREDKICINADLREYPLRKLKGLVSNVNDTINNYDNLNHRNNKRDIKKLYKHAMHLIRLLKMSNEILMTGQIFTKRPDREFLLDIRNQKYEFKEIFEIAEMLSEELKKSLENTKLPDSPDYAKIELLQMKIVKENLFDING